MIPRTGCDSGRPSFPLRGIRKLFRLALFLLVVGAGIPACSPADEKAPDHSDPIPEPDGFPVRIQDAAGKPLSFLTPPTRILSLVPSATRTLLALEAQDALVGRTQHDTTSALAHLPSVGGGLDPSIEALVALGPDLVIRFAGESDTATPSRLDDFGIRHMAVRLDRMSDVRSLVEDLGLVTGSRVKARELLEEMDATLREIRSRVGQAPSVRVAYVLGGNPPWVAGPGTYIDELLTIAGGENVFSDLGSLYGPVSLEQFLTRDIDLLLAPQGAEVLLHSPDLPLAEVSPALELPGPDLAQAAWELALLLHPEPFR